MAQAIFLISEEEKEALIKKEKSTLTRVFKELPDKKKKVAEKLIEEAAFIKTVLKEARLRIMQEGIIEEYQNGENQRGVKKSAAVEVYDKYIDKYMRICRQLADMLPEDKQSGAIKAGEQLMQFMAAKDK